MKNKQNKGFSKEKTDELNNEIYQEMKEQQKKERGEVLEGKISEYHYKFLMKILKELTKTDSIPLDAKEISDLKIIIDSFEEWE